ncbi:MAG TPA: cytochrome P450, partial [Candidatus Hodarchaeales archaeon]|nr:cytochrome P450 [Candidatus Hodarchaeales archaeon]
IRSLISKAMSPRMINNLKPHIEEIAYELLEDIKGKTEIELIKEFAYPLPVLVIAELLGVPDEDRDKLKVWAKYLVKSVDALPMSSEEHKMLNKAGAEVAAYFGSLIAERRGSEGEDLITQLTKANDGGISLTSGELISNCAFLLIAGHETTMNLITNGTLALLTNPEQLEILRSDPKIAENATEELLRYDSPVQLIGRVAYAPFVFGDVTVAEGEQLGLFLGAANRDPEVFTNPDQLDITRKELAHLAFGQGIHYCLGAPLGRLEGEIAFKAIFETFPNLKVKDVRHEYRPSFSMRELLSLRLLTQ